MDWLISHQSYAGDDCLKWPYGCGTNGYGLIHQPNGSGQRSAPALMCEFISGPKPSDDHECAHSCGKGHEGCINPKHLRWATRSENQAERISHGTEIRGEKAYQAKLTREQVRCIRELAGVRSKAQVAREFGVSDGAVRGIQSGATWAWLP